MSFGSLEGYGYHGLGEQPPLADDLSRRAACSDRWHCVAECLQTFVEKRKGGECGVSAVTMLEGDDVWNSLYGRPGEHCRPLATIHFPEGCALRWWSLCCVAGASEAGRDWKWPTALIEAAITHGQQTYVGFKKYSEEDEAAVAPGRPEEWDYTSGAITKENPRGMVSEGGPHAFLIEYSDGFCATLLHLTGYVRDWQIALRVDGEIRTSVLSTAANPHPSFSLLGLNIQQMFLTGRPTYPVERTLLVTGALDSLMESHAAGHTRVPTPHLSEVAYTPMDPALTIRG